ncbi:MAG: flagellin FliC [Thermoleophilia bacterium]|nr:flagellin FliC [Thermoleophilia bacterium]
MQRLSSGLRINSARDDAAGLGISERLRGQIRGLEQADRNIQDGISLLQTMDGVLNEVHSILQRARELAVQRNNGGIGTQAKNAIKSEFLALCAEIGRIEGSTQFNGIPLLQNASAVLTLQVGANDGEMITISLVDLIGGGAGSLVRPNTFFTVSWNDADLAGFDLHIDDVATARGRLGAIQNRLEYALSANQNTRENLMGAESRIRDVDVASEMSNYVRTKILQQGATAMLAQANQAPRNVLSLLR